MPELIPLPCSRKQVNKLGKRLRDQDTLSGEDNVLLTDVLVAYEDAKDFVVSQLAAMGLEATGRTKETRTLREKLQRMPSMALLSIDDIAGARIVLAPGSRSEQWRVVDAITERFTSDDGPEPEILDRCAHPSHGYRAVHVVVQVRGLKVEVQVRTELQDLWAQVVEKLGDSWGRELRYGLSVQDGHTPVTPKVKMTRNEFVELLVKLSALIGSFEEQADRVDKLHTRLTALVRRPSMWVRHPVTCASLMWDNVVLRRSGRRVSGTLRQQLENLRSVVDVLGGAK